MWYIRMWNNDWASRGMLNEKTFSQNKKENRNEVLAAVTAKESEYTAVVSVESIESNIVSNSCVLKPHHIHWTYIICI